MPQLNLTHDDLLKIGFKEVTHPADELNSERITYEIPIINGVFYYNPFESEYTWYQRVIIGEVSNFIHLNIEKAPELFMILSCFRVKHTLFII